MKRLCVLTGLLVFALLFTGSLATAASISGKVYQSDGNTEVTEVTVYVQIKQGNPCMGYTNIGQVQTNTADGSYSITNLPAGTYYLVTENQNLSDYINEWWAQGGSTVECTGAHSITVADSDTLNGYDFQLDKGGSVSGTVRDGSGTPLTGEHILVQARLSESGDICGDNVYYRLSLLNDQNGTYTIRGLPTGFVYILTNNEQQSNFVNEWYTAGASDPSDFDCHKAQALSITPGASINGINFNLDLGGTVSGTVYQSDGTTPLTGEDIQVQAWLADDICQWTGMQLGGFKYINSTDGTYELKGLPQENLYLRTNDNNNSFYLNEWYTGGSPDPSDPDCNEAQTIEVTSGATIGNTNFSLEAVGSISGTVSGESGPIQGVWIQVYDDRCWNNYLGGAETDGNGNFTVNGISAGEAFVHTCASECRQMNYVDRWYGDRIDCNDAAPVSVVAGQAADDIDFYLPTGGSLSGHIEDADGAPVSNLRVSAHDAACNGLWTSGANTDSNGNYTIYGVPVGSSYVWTCANCNGHDYVDEAYDNVYLCSQASSVSVSTNSNTPNIDFALDADSDNDGMGDGWEEVQFGDYSHDGSSDEGDHDGLNDLDEFRYMTDPNDADSDNDGISDGYEIEQGTDPNDSGSAPDIPVIGSVMHVRQPDGSDVTWVEVYVEPEFTGQLPDDITAVSITGPGLNLNMGDLTYFPQWRSYFTEVPELPQLGTYSFTVNSNIPSSGTDTDEQTVVRDIPIPDTSQMQPADGATLTSKTPIFTLAAVDSPDVDLYYRLTVYDMSENRVYASGRIKDRLFCTVPENVLTPGETYRYQWRVTDDDTWEDVENRANGQWFTFTVAANRFHAAVPAVDLSYWGVVNWENGSFIGRDHWVKIIDQDGVANDGSSHQVTVIPPGENPIRLDFKSPASAVAGYYGFFKDMQGVLPTSGDYLFKVTDPDDNTSTFVDHLEVNSLDPVDEDSLQPSNKSPVVKSITATADNIYVNGSLYDDFDGYTSIDELDSSRWESHRGDVSMVDDESGGKKLEFTVVNTVGRGDSYVKFADAAAINTVKADITVAGATSDDCFSRITWYSKDHNGLENWSAFIYVKSDKVTYSVFEEFYPNKNFTWNTVVSGILETISPGQTVAATISWNTATRTLTFDADGNTASYTFPAEATLPNWTKKLLQTRINLVTSTTPTFSWDPVAGGQTYRVKIYNWDTSRDVWNGYTGATSYPVPPGVLTPNTYYRYRIDVRDSHSGFETDNNTRTPVSSWDYYIFYTDDQEAVDPYIEFDSHGAFTWNNEVDGSELGFWIKVHDAQGVPGDIASVTVDLPGGGQETLEYDGGYSGNTATSGFYNKFNLPAPAKGSHNYTFHVTDKEGNTYSVDETINANLLDPVAKSSVSAAYNAADHTVDFIWSPVSGAAFYRVEVYENPPNDYNRLYSFATTTNSYRMPEGFLKQGVLYRYRITARREFFDDNVDNASSSHSPSAPDMPMLVIGYLPGDIDKDGGTDGTDLATLAAQFGDTICDGGCSADLNGDGKVDDADLAIFAQFFGHVQ